MENKIKNAPDITYMSELILDTKPMTLKWNLTCQGLIHTITYSHFRVRKLCVH